jgi:acyl carrier protein
MVQGMTKEEIFDRVSAILIDSFELEPTTVHLSAHLIEDLDLDSIDAVDLAVGLEGELGLDISEDELREIKFVQDIVDLLHRRLRDT